MADTDSTPIEAENEVFDPTMMKKKKKKPSKLKESITPAQQVEEQPAAKQQASEPLVDEDLETTDFSKLKKKKKKAVKIVDLVESDQEADQEDVAKPQDDEDGESDVSENDDDAAFAEDDEFAHDVGFVNDSTEAPYVEAWIGSDRDYTYDELLGRVFRILREHNPALADGRKRYTIVPPQVAREGSKKTAFANIADICARMRRNYDHVTQFIYAELGTSGSVDGSQRLIIKGRFQPKQIENVLRRYIVEYVTCKTCKSPGTTLRKENRLYFMQCESCGSTRSVSAIKSGFQAQTGSRRAAKARTAA